MTYFAQDMKIFYTTYDQNVYNILKNITQHMRNY